MDRERSPPSGTDSGPEARGAARLAGVAGRPHHEQNTAWLARQTKADPGTIGDFLNGNRWPKYGTQGRIEKALGWPAGTLTGVADGVAEIPQLETVGGPDEDPGQNEEEEDTLLYRRPDGLTDEEWNRVRRESREFIEWQIEKASRER